MYILGLKCVVSLQIFTLCRWAEFLTIQLWRLTERVQVWRNLQNLKTRKRFMMRKLKGSIFVCLSPKPNIGLKLHRRQSRQWQVHLHQSVECTNIDWSVNEQENKYNIITNHIRLNLLILFLKKLKMKSERWRPFLLPSLTIVMQIFPLR